MKEIAYRYVIFLILASLFILMLSQGWLLFKQYQYTEQIFQDKVHNLLFDLQQQIEKDITPDKSKSFKSPYFKSLNSPQKSFYSQFLVIEGYVHPKDVKYTIDDKLVQKRQSQILAFLEKLKATSPGVDTLERISVEYVQGRNTTTTTEFNSTDFVDIKGELDKLMKEFNITTPYEYGIKNEDGQWIDRSFQADTAGLVSSTYTTTFIEDTETLYLTFPNKHDFFIQQLITYIWGTLLALLFVFSSFWYILSVVLKQKKLSELKTDFINNMTHEFKTPIATIAFASANIENKKVINQPDKILKFTEVIKKENKRMNRQVEQVLQAAMIDRKALNLNIEPINMHEIINQIADTIAIKVYSRDGHLIRQLKATQSIVEGDRMHLSNVIANLLDNAQKYSPNSPYITVVTSTINDKIHISVIDQGKGLSEEEKERVFEKFYRVPTGNLHNVKGFGLGLSYSKAVLEQHGGSISIKSKLNKGSTFTIILPVIESEYV